MNRAIGIDLGGSSVKAVAITAGGEILRRVNQEFDVEREFDFARRVGQVFNSIQEQQGASAACLGVVAGLALLHPASGIDKGVVSSRRDAELFVAANFLEWVGH